jgi:hypothetical protein
VREAELTLVPPACGVSQEEKGLTRRTLVRETQHADVVSLGDLLHCQQVIKSKHGIPGAIPDPSPARKGRCCCPTP